MATSANDDVRRVSDAERLRRWRLVLGGGDADGVDSPLGSDDRRKDAALAAVYDVRGAAAGLRGARRGTGGLGRSAPAVSRWLGDIRRYFPTPVVRVIQRDAVERLELRRLLLEPELLSTVEADVSLVAMLVELNQMLPDETRDTARTVVQAVLDELRERFEDRTRSAVSGALARGTRTRRPRGSDIDWARTIHANLRHWLPEQRTLVPERLVGHGRRAPSLARDVVVAVDQSASMADSIVYAALYGAVLAGIPSLRTHLLAFDTAVADLSDLADDPVDVLFGVQLGGGTDIAVALDACRERVTRPADTVVVLISDLFDGGDRAGMLARAASLTSSGVTLVVVLSLSDDGTPAYDHVNAEALRGLGAAVFACTPDRFPDLLAAALEGADAVQLADLASH
ncbi:MAG: VWA domain-containing protein [Actinomycetota bacterium]|nr:VWA domain-containing protein [Actinomycetota bacterium]